MKPARLFVLAVASLLLTACATTVPPEVVSGYRAGQDIEAYCAAQGAGKKPDWIAQCTNDVSFKVRSASFCKACGSKGGNENSCLRQSNADREESLTHFKPRDATHQPQIVLTCPQTTAICIAFPDSATERAMKASRDSKAKVDMTSYPGAYCPLRKSGGTR